MFIANEMFQRLSKKKKKDVSTRVNSNPAHGLLAQQKPTQNPEPNETRSHRAASMAILAGLVAVLSALLAAALRRLLRIRRRPTPAAGFFHPYTNYGGGGERVLWCAVRAVQELRPGLPCAVFTGDADASPEGLAARALERFGVRLLSPPQVTALRLGRSGFVLRSEKIGSWRSELLVVLKIYFGLV